MKKKKKDYKVGYGKPPSHSQFQKGKSGNPNGRPRKPRSFELFEDAVRAALLEEVSLNGEMIPKYQAVAVSLVNDAIRGKGNARAMLMPTILNLTFQESTMECMSPLDEDRKMLEDFLQNDKPLEEEEDP